MPKRCPICGGPVGKFPISKSQFPNKSQFQKSKISKKEKQKMGVAAYCLNPKCFAVEKEKIIHFVSKKGFNIEGLGNKIVEQLVNEGLIASAADIFELEKGDLEPLERFAEKSAQNLIGAIEESKRVEFPKFLFSLGIRHAGEETAILIAKTINMEIPNPKSQIPNKFQLLKFLPRRQAGKIKNLQDIISVFPKITAEDWMRIKGIGEKAAESLVGWFNDKSNIELLEKMKSFGVEIVFPKLQITNYKLQGLTFVLTGELERFTRDEAKDIIRKKGGAVSSSVSAKTDYLVAGKNPGSKYRKAKSLGVKIISEKEFEKMMK